MWLVIPAEYLYAQETPLAAPGSILLSSVAFTPTLLKGLSIQPENPLMFNFAIEKNEWGKKEYMEVGKDGTVWEIINKMSISALDEITIFHHSYEQGGKNSLVSGLVAQLPERNNSGVVIIRGSDNKDRIIGPEQI